MGQVGEKSLTVLTQEEFGMQEDAIALVVSAF